MVNTVRSWLYSFPRAFWFALGGCAILRAWVLFYNVDVPLMYPSDYHTMARHYLDTGMMSLDGLVPTATRLPGYSLVLVALFKITGNTVDLWQIMALNLTFTVATLFIAYRVAERVASEQVAAVTVWLLALNPTLVPLNFDHGVESIYTLILTALALSLVSLAEKPESDRSWIIVGVISGISLTVRSTFLIFPFWVTLIAWLVLPRRLTLKRIALLFGCCYVFTVPWTIRNHSLLGRIVPFEDGLGWHMLYQGSESVYGIFPDTALPEPMRTYFFKRDPRLGPHSKEIALRNIKESPLRYVGYCIGRIKPLWFSQGWAEVLFNASDPFSAYRARGDWRNMSFKIFFKSLELVFILLMLFGIVVNFGSPALTLLALIIFYMNIHLLTMGLPRYTTTVVPVMSLFVALGGAEALARIRKRFS